MEQDSRPVDEYAAWRELSKEQLLDLKWDKDEASRDLTNAVKELETKRYRDRTAADQEFINQGHRRLAKIKGEIQLIQRLITKFNANYQSRVENRFIQICRQRLYPEVFAELWQEAVDFSG